MVRYFEEDENQGLPQYLIPPEIFAESPSIQAVIGPLRRLAAEPKMADAESRTALEELAANPVGLLAFFNFLPPRIVDGKLRRHRGSMVLPPTLAPETVAAHRDLYDEVVRKLCLLQLDSLPANLREPMAVIRFAYISHLEDRYREENNPIHCWRAYRFARTTECSIPEWVMSYFDRCAASFEALVAAPPTEKVDKAIAAVLGMSSGSGRGSKLSAAKGAAFRKRIYNYIEMRISEGVSPGQACEEAHRHLPGHNMEAEPFRQLYYDIKREREAAKIAGTRARTVSPKRKKPRPSSQ